MNEYGHRASQDSTQKRQRERLGAMLAGLLASNAFYRRKFADVRFNPGGDPLSRLPFTTRADLERDQRENPPHGSNLTFPLERYTRLHQTSGTEGTPLRWLDTSESWEWWRRCWRLIFEAAGLPQNAIGVFPFSFGPFIGFWAGFEAAASRGNRVLAAGGMTSAARVRFLLENRATFVCCTPTYALHLAEEAERSGFDLRDGEVRALIVAGEPGGSIPETRAEIEKAWNARVFDHAGMTEIGAWGFETEQTSGGLFVNEEEFIAEAVDPKTGEAVPDGEIGELVLTNLGRVGSPLVRYRTGDLVRLCSPAAARTSPGERFAHWSRCEGGLLGRVDNMLVIRGNNVFPAAVEGIIRGVSGVAEFRLTVKKRGALNDLRVEVERRPDAQGELLAHSVQRVLQDRLNLRCEVAVAEPNALPRFEMKAKRIVKK